MSSNGLGQERNGRSYSTEITRVSLTRERRLLTVCRRELPCKRSAVLLLPRQQSHDDDDDRRDQQYPNDADVPGEPRRDKRHGVDTTPLPPAERDS